MNLKYQKIGGSDYSFFRFVARHVEDDGDNFLDAEVYFDTRGRSFDYHLAKIGDARLEDTTDNEIFVLYEKKND